MTRIAITARCGDSDPICTGGPAEMVCAGCHQNREGELAMYAFILGSCVNCGSALTYSPSHVPSIRVNGSKEPLCRGCFDKWNEIHRTSKGLGAVRIHPRAYEPEEMT